MSEAGLSRGRRQALWSSFKVYILSSKQSTVGFVFVLTFLLSSVVVSITGYSLLPFNPLKQDVGAPFAPPSLHNWFGTDQLGRDVFSRIVAAEPNDALISVFVIAIALGFGGLLGAYSGYRRGWVDEGLMRVTDIFFAIPSLVLAMVISVILGTGLINMMYALAIVWWPAYARLSRAEALKASRYHYVEAARISNIPGYRILVRHILPEVFGTLLVYATLDIGVVVLTYSGLSFLGLSIQPPYPDWGNMVAGYQEYIISAPWLPLFPGFVIMLVVIGFSLLGDGLRAAERARLR